MPVLLSFIFTFGGAYLLYVTKLLIQTGNAVYILLWVYAIILLVFAVCFFLTQQEY